jgi:hypothetical protein
VIIVITAQNVIIAKMDFMKMKEYAETAVLIAWVAIMVVSIAQTLNVPNVLEGIIWKIKDALNVIGIAMNVKTIQHAQLVDQAIT